MVLGDDGNGDDDDDDNDDDDDDLSGGSVSDSLTDFTGGICESYDIADHQDKEKQDRLWKIIFQVNKTWTQSICQAQISSRLTCTDTNSDRRTSKHDES